jgi:hypothetical protein
MTLDVEIAEIVLYRSLFGATLDLPYGYDER